MGQRLKASPQHARIENDILTDDDDETGMFYVQCYTDALKTAYSF